MRGTRLTEERDKKERKQVERNKKERAQERKKTEKRQKNNKVESVEKCPTGIGGVERRQGRLATLAAL
jgi:hypothetical protein